MQLLYQKRAFMSEKPILGYWAIRGLAQPTFEGGDTKERAPVKADKRTRADNRRAEKWRALGLERRLGPCPDEQELAHLLREFEEEELARGPAC